jgi:hypothetical protein
LVRVRSIKSLEGEEGGGEGGGEIEEKKEIKNSIL